jgi:putative toxin-antitoxin system antitoxin component (TIGR02293 family)
MAKRKPAPNTVSEPQAEYVRLRPKQARAAVKRPAVKRTPLLTDAEIMEAAVKPVPKQRLRASIASGVYDAALLAKVLGIKKAQMALRLEGVGSLIPAEGERVLLAERLLARGVEVFGNKDKFDRWLRSPIVALGHRRPLDLMASVVGMRLVADELETIAHGVFA